jgi:hypothetical protein
MLARCSVALLAFVDAAPQLLSAGIDRLGSFCKLRRLRRLRGAG